MPPRRDRHALFERIVAQYGAPLVAYAARLSGNPTAAEDIVQDAFLRFATSWKGPLEPSPQMTLWLRRTVHNAAVDAVRRETRMREVHLRDAEERGDSVPPSSGQGGAPGDVSDAAAEAAEALAILTERERDLVVMKVYEERSYREIAAATGLSEGNVGFILHSARAKLAAHLAARGAAAKKKGTAE